MSRKYPIISITGSSGAGTTSVKKTFEQIFFREKVNAAYIEGDAFHRYDRAQMRTQMAKEADRGNRHFSHFSPETNLFEELHCDPLLVASVSAPLFARRGFFRL
jgi:phosphoribulokinase